MSIDVNRNKAKREWRQSKLPILQTIKILNTWREWSAIVSKRKQEKKWRCRTHICKPRVSKCSYETPTMRTQVKQAKSDRNTVTRQAKCSPSSSHRFNCRRAKPFRKIGPGPNKFSYHFFSVGETFWNWGLGPSAEAHFGKSKTITPHPSLRGGGSPTLEVKGKCGEPW